LQGAPILYFLGRDNIGANGYQHTLFAAFLSHGTLSI